jgi:sulfatase modifying factor 1
MLLGFRSSAAVFFILEVVGCGSAMLRSQDGGGAGASGSGGAGGLGGIGAISPHDSGAGADGHVGANDAAGEGPVVSYGPFCDGLPTTCGQNGNENCCASRVVPGGTFNV